MATTSLWHISGGLRLLLDYVENPEKTVPKDTEDFFRIFSYMQRGDKTRDECVSAINCLKSTALQEMIITKRRFGKTGGYIAWHGYQSFKPGEVTPELAHQIGAEFAKRMWGDRYQIVVTTHLDKEHLHNHYAFSSTSFKDGKKYNYSKAEQQRLRDTSDLICIEYGLSVINRPHKAPSRPVWLDEKDGKPTRYNVYREDVRNALENTGTPEYMEEYLQRLGYITDFTGRHWKLRLPQYEHFTRLDTLDERWTPQFLYGALEFSPYYKRLPEVTFSPHTPDELRNAYTPHKQTPYIKRLYLYYCFQLGVLPKEKRYKPVSPFLREELRKLDHLDAQVRYMAGSRIDTMDDLLADRKTLEQQLSNLTVQRTKIQNRIRRVSPEEQTELRKEKSALTAEITGIRKKLNCNYEIEARSKGMQETLDRIYDNELAHRAAPNKFRERGYEK